MKRATFYRCEVCGNIVVQAYDGGGVLSCCGQPMKVIDPNTTDAAAEKHVPVAELDAGFIKVSVGSTLHPMEENHYIQWVYVVTDQGVIAHCFKPGDKPEVELFIGNQKPLMVFEFCNLHGLWKTDL